MEILEILEILKVLEIYKIIKVLEILKILKIILEMSKIYIKTICWSTYIIILIIFSEKVMFNNVVQYTIKKNKILLNYTK